MPFCIAALLNKIGLAHIFIVQFYGLIYKYDIDCPPHPT